MTPAWFSSEMVLTDDNNSWNLSDEQDVEGVTKDKDKDIDDVEGEEGEEEDDGAGGAHVRLEAILTANGKEISNQELRFLARNFLGISEIS
jgi:hypothetical protein